MFHTHLTNNNIFFKVSDLLLKHTQMPAHTHTVNLTYVPWSPWTHVMVQKSDIKSDSHLLKIPVNKKNKKTNDVFVLSFSALTSILGLDRL